MPAATTYPYRKTFLIGAALFAGSYLQLLIPGNLMPSHALAGFFMAFMAGVVLVSEGITQRYANKSLLTEIFQRKRNLVAYLAVTTIAGLMLEVTGVWWSKLWVYPGTGFPLYALAFVGGYGVYWLMILESYLAGKALLHTFVKERRAAKKPRYEAGLFRALGIASLILVPFGVVIIARDLARAEFHFSISEITPHSINGPVLILFVYGVWFLLEYLEYVRGRGSMLDHLLRHSYGSFITICVVSVVLSIVMETLNLAHHWWIYTNWPLDNIRFLDLPILLFFAWILHYILSLSLFNARTQFKSAEVWR